MFDYIFYYKGRQLEIVTNTIAEALEHLRFREPNLSFVNLLYFINMKTGVKTPVFDTRKILLDNSCEVS